MPKVTRCKFVLLRFLYVTTVLNAIVNDPKQLTVDNSKVYFINKVHNDLNKWRLKFIKTSHRDPNNLKKKLNKYNEMSSTIVVNEKNKVLFNATVKNPINLL